MAQAEFSLQEKDKKRLIKDRLVRLAVTSGGVGVLAALILIFVYLAMVIIPLFSDAEIKPNHATRTTQVGMPLAISVDDYSQLAFVLTQSGEIQYLSMDAPDKPAIYTQQLATNPVSFSQSAPGLGWYGLVDDQGLAHIFKPEFNATLRENTRPPEVVALSTDMNLTLTDAQDPVTQFVFSASTQTPTIVWQTRCGKVKARWQEKSALGAAPTTIDFSFSAGFDAPQQMLLTPDGETLYLRDGSELIVLTKAAQKFTVREVIDLTQGDKKHSVRTIDLLAGAYSLLVTHNDGRVSQWFDTLQNDKRTLTHIRDFKLASELKYLLPDSHRKGFYSFYTNGTLQSHYTTSEKLVLFKRAYKQAPAMAAMSNNERYLITWNDDSLKVAEVDNSYPEVSLSSLWQKVWYEGYPEPEFVWQSTSASDNFEAKFSLVPIAFGTIKAAMFAMLFSVPLAVLGAIYTAYFMSPRMRRVVKPSIELMEALPTVIIGFLAGLWFAPIVEDHLITVVVMLFVLPLSTMVMGGLWALIPQSLRNRLPNGWHALVLMPVILLLIGIGVWISPSIEQTFFGGDMRLFLTNHGIGFDQRNSLVVGLAMGFAVIPTIFTIAEDAIFSVPKHLSDGSLALGATPWQTLIYVVLLTASPGIFSAIMMGLGRAVGETMIVLMATGNTPLMDWNILEGLRSLSATIAVELPESEVGSSHYRLLFLAALILFVFTFAVNALAELVRQRLRDKYRAL
ncbi:ABC transporter permease subunit [Vibrio parahaemolyticus]|uniref:ABC transporter permease subunit n=1 Tax=Vibrio parahaemolyticus TaxID=670 RepID=UPI0003ED8E6A|nr:ABC transporter permease subunit [Vibrio parahaemolyticus]AHI98519.1 Phosphate transport system permease protein PstC [Vibrio parahaemolyticus UCM-V493]EHH1060462.1 ABC transporter permease subunit [Vibrio parahaemolyticus]MBE4396129.1 ABC transporter permease subunit [Vibrio parahaemolyticus]MDF4456986.1 ABC transporter permease subunit [Vibrio parahaemolyticus]TOA83097.1 phosphate ABC transporter permease [Vibrio parahaemolyticus]